MPDNIKARCSMRTFLGLLILVLVFAMAGSGCGEPKPPDSSKFDKAAYDDVNAAAKTLSEDKAVSH